MTIVIPHWLLWTIGIAVGVPAVVAFVILACLGVMFLRMLGKWRGW